MSTKQTFLDKQTLSLLNKLEAYSNTDKLKQFIEDQEFDYELIIDDVIGPPEQSDILEIVGKKVFEEIKSLICCIENGQDLLNVNDKSSVPISLDMTRNISHPFNYNDHQLPQLQQLPHQQSIPFGSDIDDDYIMVHNDDDHDEKQPHKTNADDIEHKYDDNPQIQNLIALLQQLPDKNAINVLLHFLHEENFETMEEIKEDIEDESNSSIFEELENNNIDNSFFTAFIDKVKEMDNQRYIEKAIESNDEWSVILQRMMRNTSFSNQIYYKTINYFRDEQWSVQDYKDDEMGATQKYENSYFHDIFPDITHQQRKQLINIFEKAILNEPTTDNDMTYTPTATPCTPITPFQPPSVSHINDNNNNDNNNDNHQSSSFHQNVAPNHQQSDDEKKEEDDMNNDEDEEIEDGDVDDLNHPRYKKIAKIIDRCAAMIIASEEDSNKDGDLKALCSIFDMNQVLQISDILCRQYLVALYHKNEDCMNHLLQDLTTNNEVTQKLEQFITKEYWKKTHNEERFPLYVAGSFNVLQLSRWLGYNTPPIESNYDMEIQESINDPNEILKTRKLKCNARDAQIYIFAFLISSARMLIKNFENTNVQLVLDMKFPHKMYYIDDVTMSKVKLKRKSLQDLQSKIIKFAEPFENHAVRGIVRDKIEKEHCMMVQTVDFNKSNGTKQRWNNLKPKAFTLNKKHIGFDMTEKEYMKTFDNNELFQVCRVKKYIMEQQKKENNNNGGGGRFGGGCISDRICISLHKFGNTLKYYLHFESSVFRINMEDLCAWFPAMFEKNDTALSWDVMDKFCNGALRDNEKLADITHNGLVEVDEFNYYYNNNENEKVNEKTNFWRNIQKWTDLDKEFYKKCDKFTYEMKKRYCLKYGQQVFDKNIVDKQAVINNYKH